MSHADKKVFITGGSKGIGRELALLLAREGANVAIGARGQADLDKTLADLVAAGKEGQRFAAISMDVTDRESVKAGAEAALGALGGLDLLVCNSGYAHPGYTDELDDSVFEDMINVNYLGHVNVVRAFLPTLKAQKKGHICLVSSRLGYMSVFGYGAYSASKYAIVGFAEALRQEMLNHGVGVNIYYPPTTKTPGLEKENEVKPKAVWAMESESAFNKVYEPAQVAQSILKSIDNGTFEANIGWDGYLMFYAYRWTPRLARWLADMDMKKAIGKTG